MQEKENYQVGLYLRLSKDDMQQGESMSISNQRLILTDYCNKHQLAITKTYVDDGYSGTTFDRPGFRELLEDVERGVIDMVITKDLSRLGRDYIMTGYYSEIFFQTKGIRYVAIGDNYDTLEGYNEIAPFKNILNDMYARDISKKIKSAKHQRAKQGLFIGSQTPYGYQTEPNKKGVLIVDPEAAETVRLIFQLATEGLGSVAIADELRARRIVAPSVDKYLKGDLRFSSYPAVKNGDHYLWCPTTISQILSNKVYTGRLTSLKTESTSYKTKQRTFVPLERQIVTENAHEAIVTKALFDEVQQIRATRGCRANTRRFNLFRGKLFCSCCGHPLAISTKQLLDRKTDIYLCMHHYHRPDLCPQTHRVYHDMLYPYVLQQIRQFAKSMKSRKVNSPVVEYTTLQELTPEVLDTAIERIEIGHIKYNSPPGRVIQIYWKLK
jgi:DNA invertase Pin-like site-specific DNA recombinase